MKALVTVELQLCGDLFFSLCRADGIQHQLGTLLRTGLIRNNAVVIEITDDRKIQESLLGSDVRNMMLGSLYAITEGAAACDDAFRFSRPLVCARHCRDAGAGSAEKAHAKSAGTLTHKSAGNA